jgi:hypothetical protein
VTLRQALVAAVLNAAAVVPLAVARVAWPVGWRVPPELSAWTDFLRLDRGIYGSA